MSSIDLGKRNHVKDTGDELEISLRIGDDFPFDIDRVTVCYNKRTHAVSVKESEIPEHIKGNMERFFGGCIEDYVLFLEQNLECFFKGDVPRGPVQAAERPKSVCAGQRDASSGGAARNVPRRTLVDVSSAAAYKGPLNVEIRAYRSNVAFLMCRRPRLQVECSRCKKHVAVEESCACPSCSNSICVRYSCAVSSGFLGNLVLTGASFVCFGRMDYQFSCLECGEGYECQIEKGAELEFNCHRCARSILIRIEHLCFRKKEPQNAPREVALHNKGTCVHYKKSFRLFKFPCCNGVFPCDVCHNSVSGHRAVLASRMICGLCGKEQNVSTQCACGMVVGRASAFWEGGKGTRDKSKMSRKDKKKYRR